MLEDAAKVHLAMLENHQEALNARQEQLYNIDAEKASTDRRVFMNNQPNGRFRKGVQ